jgi:hypothetical protein
MKRALVLCTALVAIVGLSSISMAQGIGGFLGARFGPLEVGRPGYVNALIRYSGEIGLSSDQVEKLRSIATSFEKEAAKVQADIRVAEVELGEMLGRKDVKVADVESKIKQIESLESGLRLSMTKAQIEARGLLTDEQLAKVESLKRDVPFRLNRRG